MEVDRLSHCLGMIFAFAEVVGSGVKPLALSPPLHKEEVGALDAEARKVASQFGVILEIDDQVLETLLFDPAFTAGKSVFLLAADRSVLAQYHELKAGRRAFGAGGDTADEQDLARRFGRLLGYSTETIGNLLREPRFGAGQALPGQ